MRKVRVVLSSPYNMTVKGKDIIEVGDDCIGDDGELTDKAQEEIWEDAVYGYMASTYVELIEED
jgi:hypothetical protein